MNTVFVNLYWDLEKVEATGYMDDPFFLGCEFRELESAKENALRDCPVLKFIRTLEIEVPPEIENL